MAPVCAACVCKLLNETPVGPLQCAASTWESTRTEQDGGIFPTTIFVAKTWTWTGHRPQTVTQTDGKTNTRLAGRGGQGGGYSSGSCSEYWPGAQG